MEQFNRKQKPYVKCITKEEYNTNKDKLKNNEIINIDNKQNNPVTKTGGLYCLARNNSFVHICKVNTIHSDNTSIELQPLMEINWEQWINFGGQRKVTKQGKLQNYKEFVEEIHSILPQTNRIERVIDTEVIDNEVTEVLDNEVTEVTDNEVTEVTEVTENGVSEVISTEDNKQLFEEMKEELVKANKNITTLTNKINKLTYTIQETIQETIQKTDKKTIQETNQETNKKEKPNYSLRNTIIFFMPLIIAGIYKYNIDLQFFNITL